jgi:hypothetical protein
VLHDEYRRWEVGGQLSQDLLQGTDAPSRRPHAHDVAGYLRHWYFLIGGSSEQ